MAKGGSGIKVMNDAFQRIIIVYLVAGGIINSNVSRVQPADVGSLALMERML